MSRFSKIISSNSFGSLDNPHVLSITGTTLISLRAGTGRLFSFSEGSGPPPDLRLMRMGFLDQILEAVHLIATIEELTSDPKRLRREPG